jgi:hypothetical protein
MGMFDRFYDAFQNAETGKIKDPWIRTKVNIAPGSSAYGPVQITRGLVDKSEAQGLFKGTSIESWVDDFQKQGDMFLYHGNMKGKIPDYDPNYDYGGSGHLNTDKDKANYKIMSDLLLKDAWKGVKNTKNPVENLIKVWKYGIKVAPTHTMDDKDTKPYFQRFARGLKDPFTNP